MKYYYISSSPDEYNLEGAFKNLEFIDWQNSRSMNMETGSIILIYTSQSKKTKEEGRIKYIAQVVDSKVPNSEILNNDTEYYILPKNKSSLSTTEVYIRMKTLCSLTSDISEKLKQSDLEKIKFNKTGKHFNFTGKQEIKSPLLDYILEVLKPLHIKELEAQNKTTLPPIENNIPNYKQTLTSMIDKYAKALPNRLNKTSNNYWNALRSFPRNTTKMDTDEFLEYLKKTLRLTGLVFSKTKHLIEISHQYPTEFKNILHTLYDGHFSINKDYLKVSDSIKTLVSKYCIDNNIKKKDLHNELNSNKYITGYLWAVKPETYYIYSDKDLDNCQTLLGISRKYSSTDKDKDLEKINEQIKNYEVLRKELLNNRSIIDTINTDSEISAIDSSHNTLIMDFLCFLNEETSNSSNSNETIKDSNIQYNNPTPIKFITGGKNIIVYGAPGVGKSWHVNKAIEGKYNNRVIFHNEYTYFDFIGAYKPVPVFKKTNDIFFDAAGSPATLPGNPYINYEFVPGPFIDTLIHAYQNPQDMHYLVIEELNRANAAAVFGDIFQLLDRDNEGKSEYSIKISRELYNYLASKDINLEKVAQDFRIPSNMTIYATMNSADQGVNYMDSAFKRRWEYEYIPIIEKQIPDQLEIEYAGNTYKYRIFLSKLNELLKERKIDEDRLIGPWFLKENEEATTISYGNIQKLNLYLWDDIFRHNRNDIFKNVSTLHELNDKFAKEDVLGIKEKLPISQNGEEQ